MTSVGSVYSMPDNCIILIIAVIFYNYIYFYLYNIYKMVLDGQRHIIWNIYVFGMRLGRLCLWIYGVSHIIKIKQSFFRLPM